MIDNGGESEFGGRTDHGPPMQRLQEQEKAVAELRRAHTFLSAAVDAAGEAIIGADRAGRITLFNARAETLLGYQCADLLGEMDSLLFPERELELLRSEIRAPQEAGAFELSWMRAGTRGEEKETYCTLKHKEGPEIRVALALSRIGTEHEGYLAIVRREVRSADSSENELASIIETIPHPVFVKDLQGRYLECNNAFAAFVGKKKECVLAATAEELFSADFSHKEYQTHRALLRGEASASFNTRSRRSDGTMRDLSVKKCTLHKKDGSLRGIVGAVLDITEQKATREELQLQTTVLEAEIANHQLAEEALRERERMLSSIVNAVPQTIFWKDTDMVYLGCNDNFARAAGLSSSADVVGKTDFDLPWALEETLAYRRDDREVMTLDLSKVHIEETQLQADGRKLVVDTTKIPLHNDSGLVVGVLGVYEDISERKRVEQELKESEERLRHIFDASQVGIILLSKEGKIVFANRRLAEMFGCTLHDLLGTRYVDWLHSSGKEEGQQTTGEMLSGARSTIMVERRYVRRDGSEFIGYISGRRMVEEDGSLRGLVGCIADITELKNSKTDLEREKERLAVTLRSIGDGVITVDTAGKVAILSRAAEEFCGITQQEAVGRPLAQIFKVVSEENGSEVQSPVNLVLETGRTVEHAEHTVLIPDGTRRIIASSAAPILDRKREMLGVILVFRDITEKKSIEEELFKARKLESLGILAGGIAHDFNNLLTGIMGNISLARLNLPREHEAAHFLERAQRASERSRDLTQQLLTFSKGGAPVKKLTSLSQIIVESASFALMGSNVRCTFDIADDLWPAEIDAGQMSRVISNLVINADQAMPEGGLLVIRAENVLPLEADEKDKKVRITLKDTGVGISGEHRQRIFDPYFTTKRSGSGLGLATVYSIIKKHDGELKVFSRENHGTTFAITLPAQERKVELKVETAPEASSLSGRILVMDDEEAIREVACASLEMLGFEPETCCDGSEMLELYQKAREEGAPYRAVIMDLTVPGGMGGGEAVQKLLKLDPEALAVASSGYSEDDIMAHYGAHGFAGVISKPYGIHELKSCLSEILRHKRG